MGPNESPIKVIIIITIYLQWTSNKILINKHGSPRHLHHWWCPCGLHRWHSGTAPATLVGGGGVMGVAPWWWSRYWPPAVIIAAGGGGGGGVVPLTVIACY